MNSYTMNLDFFQVFTIGGITATTLLGIFNFRVNIRSERKAQRELVFTRQFEFFMQLQSLISALEESLIDFNMGYSEIKFLQKKIFKEVDELDRHISRNEIIIPEALFQKVNDLIITCHKISECCIERPMSIDKQFKRSFLNISVELTEDIREFLGIEKLSNENLKLRNERIKKNLNFRATK